MLVPIQALARKLFNSFFSRCVKAVVQCTLFRSSPCLVFEELGQVYPS